MAPFSRDDRTILLLHFDRAGRIESLRPGLRILGNALPGAEGRFGRAARLPRGTELEIDLLAGAFPIVAGTLEFWIRPRWADAGPVKRSVLSAFLLEESPPKSYLAINRQHSRFGVALLTRSNGAKQYHRADTPIARWRPNTWHHVAVTWNRDELTLWLDGIRVAQVDGARFPQPPPDHLLFTGSDYDLDELRISRGTRYSSSPGNRLLETPEAPVLRPGTSSGGPTAPPRAFQEPDDAYRLRTRLPSSIEEFAIFAKKGLGDFKPSAALPAEAEQIELAGAPGEVLIGSGVIAAASRQNRMQASISSLAGPNGTRIPQENLDLWRVVRTPRRVHALIRPERKQTVGAFLIPWAPSDMRAVHFREFWIAVRLPKSSEPGNYKGTLIFRSEAASRSIPITVRVWPLRLKRNTDKSLGIYYLMESKIIDPPRIQREVDDLIDHGVRHLVTDLTVKYLKQGNNDYEADVAVVERGLNLLRQSGFRGVVVCKSGFYHLARRLDETFEDNGILPEPSMKFKRASQTALQALEQVDSRFPDLRLLVSHMDEIFDEPWRFGAYATFSRSTRKFSELPLYATVSMWHQDSEGWPSVLFPLVDVVSVNGGSLDRWLDHQHHMSDLTDVLKANGLSAWAYFNQRTTDYTPEWARIINGIYLWASPFETHAPWAYQRIHASAYEDTDGAGADFVMTVPDPDDLKRLSPSRYWEGMRQGWYDLRYLETLESAVDEAVASNEAVVEARRTLDWVRALVAGPRGPMSAGPPPWKNKASSWHSYDGVNAELPRVSGIAKTLGDEDWRQFRQHLAGLISKLQHSRAD